MISFLFGINLGYTQVLIGCAMGILNGWSNIWRLRDE